MRIKTISAILTALFVFVGLSACADAAGFNDADVTFAQDMIPHHRQATEMADLAADRTENQEIRDLAAKIKAAQQPEIDTMTGWLKSWDKDVPKDSSMPGMDHGSDMNMPGMMSEDDMSELESASGEDFDRRFLTMMIAHHEGAIEMATQQQRAGQYDHAVDLAKKIEKDQQAEIATMEELLSGS